MTSRSILIALGFVAACGGSQAPAAESASEAGAPEPAATTGGETPAPVEPQTFADQVALGQTLYGEKCAGCHGDAGEGTEHGPRVVGLAEGALPLDPPAERKVRKTQFKTVADVATFAVQNMPPKKPGSLQEYEYWSILAFDLKANGIELPQKLDAALAPTLEIPRK